MDLNDPELEFSDLVYAYQSWVIAVINDEKLNGKEKLLTEEISDDALNAMRFLPGEVTSAIETSLARVYEVDSDELSEILFPEEYIQFYKCFKTYLTLDSFLKPDPHGEGSAPFGVLIRNPPPLRSPK